MNDYIQDKPRQTIRKEVYTRMNFAYERGAHYYETIQFSMKGGNIFSCRATNKFLQARRIYIHYQNEFQRNQNLPLSGNRKIANYWV
jgi:hypothetical protein